MADWSRPDLDSLEINVLDEIKDRDDSLAKMFQGTNDTQIPENAIQWDWSTGVFNRRVGNNWQPTLLGVAGGGTGANNAATARANLGANNANNLTTGTVGSARLPAATTSVQGAVILNDTVSSTSATQAATANAVRQAYNRAADYAPSKTGAGASGTWGISVSGSAGVANENRGSRSALVDTGLVSSVHLRQLNVSGNSIASNNYSQVNASNGATASGQRSQVNSSFMSTASGDRSQVNASNESTASGTRSQVNASEGSTASSICSQVNTSADAIIEGIFSQLNSSHSCDITNTAAYSQINSSTDSIGSGVRCQVNSSERVRNDTWYSSAWGYGISGSASTANQQIRLESAGVGRFKGGTTTGGFDYAEYFPNLNKGIIPDGTIVTLVDEKIVPAKSGDFILGTVSATAGVIGNAPEFCWSNRFLKDEFGRELKEEADFVRWTTEDDFYDGLASECDKPIPSDATYYKQGIPITNPDYVDISGDYKPRGDRKDEWSIIGLMGQVYVRVYEDIPHNTYVGADGKQSNNESRLYCMKMTTPFDSTKGYGVAFCLLR